MSKKLDNIVIKRLDSGNFDVIVGSKYADHLTYEEMIGLVSTLCVNNKCLMWLQTKEAHELRRSLFGKQTEGNDT